jgi:dienelactone hydrolase
LTDVVLFHHGQGLTPGVRQFADNLRGEGHRVTVPDLFEGTTFDTLDAGLEYAGQVGFGAIMERGRLAADGLTGAQVYAGFSLGVLPAQMLAQTRPDAKGALFFHACVPVSEFGDKWPPGVPVQIHAMDQDPYFVAEGDLDAARALVQATDSAELFLYPGDQHLFADEGLPSYNRDAATLLTERVLQFLGQYS